MSSTVVRDFRTDDLSRLRRMIVDLKHHHQGSEHKDVAVSEDEFLDFIQSHCIRVLILATKCLPPATPTAVGCMMYIPELSLLHASHGFELNQFFIESVYRGSGCGRWMMAELSRQLLATGGTYIKVIHEEGRNLDQVYTRLGFTNYTKKTNSYHLFMQQGRQEVDEFISQSADTVPKELPFTVTIVPAHEATQASLKTHLFCGWKAKLPDLFFNCPERSSLLPPAQLVLVTCNRVASRQCLFLEQPSVFGWTGPVVIFSGFLGDPNVLTPELLYTRAKVWYDKMPRLSSIEWEIPYQVEGKSVLACSLHKLKISDLTKTLGMNITFLEGENIRRFDSIPG